jgi:hypothetical protein
MDMKTKLKSTSWAARTMFGEAVCVAAACLISTSAHSQNLFASVNHYIIECNPGDTYSTFGNVGGSLGAVINGIAFNSAGDLFAASGGGGVGAVYEFTPGGAESTFATGLDGPWSLAFNNAGTLFMGDASGKISEFTPGGVQSTFASGLHTPYATALAFNSAGDLFVGESFNGTPNSGYIDEITPNGVVSTFASGLENPYALAFNSAGDLFAADFNTGIIYEYAADGARSIFTSGLTNPEGMAFNNAGNLFVSDGGSIYEYTPSGARSTFFAFPPPSLATDALAFQAETLPVPEPSFFGLLAVGGTILFLFVHHASIAGLTKRCRQQPPYFAVGWLMGNTTLKVAGASAPPAALPGLQLPAGSP